MVASWNGRKAKAQRSVMVPRDAGKIWFKHLQTSLRIFLYEMEHRFTDLMHKQKDNLQFGYLKMKNCQQKSRIWGASAVNVSHMFSFHVSLAKLPQYFWKNETQLLTTGLQVGINATKNRNKMHFLSPWRCLSTFYFKNKGLF